MNKRLFYFSVFVGWYAAWRWDTFGGKYTRWVRLGRLWLRFERYPTDDPLVLTP